MFGELLNTDRLRRIIRVGARRARAIDNWYMEAGYTQAERRGKRYRIRYGTAMNVCEIDSRGKTTRGWCFVPCETFVAGDVMLAQKIALETDEWRALAVAIKFKPTWY